MNNKKLFKGALVLFASILMAVSCSNKDNTGPNDPNNPNNPNNPGTQKEKLAISLSAKDSALTTKTTTYVVKKGSGTVVATSVGVEVVLEGNDKALLKTDGSVNVSIVGLVAAKANEMETTMDTDLTPAVDLSSDDGFVAGLFKVEKTAEAGKVKISIKDKAGFDYFFDTSTGKLKTANNFTVGTITLKFEDSTEKKDAAEVSLPIVIGNKA